MTNLDLLRYIPQNSDATYFDHVNAVVYSRINEKGQVVILGYRGKRIHPDFHYSFSNQQKADQYVNEWIASLERHKLEKEKIAQQRKAFTHNLKVGHILKSTWGYDQTNVNFYEVIKVNSAKTVTIREIKSIHVGEGHFLSGKKIPCPGEYIGEPMVKRVSRGNYIRIESFCSASLWDGKPCYYSWTH